MLVLSRERDQTEQQMVAENITTVGEIYRAIPQIMRAVGHVCKDRKNQAQGYNFRGIDDMYNAVHGPMRDAGVFPVPKLLDLQVSERETGKGGIMRFTTVKVQYLFCAADGSSIEVVAPGEAFDSGDKSCNKAMSAALKYALMQLLLIPTEGDNDTENHTHELAAPRADGNGPAPQNFQPEKMKPVSQQERPAANVPPGARVINSVTEKSGNNKNTGKPWTLYTVQTTGQPNEFKTFDTSLAEHAKALADSGLPAIIRWTEKKNGNYKNCELEAIDECGDSAPSASAEPPAPIDPPHQDEPSQLPSHEDGLKMDATVTEVSDPRIAQANGRNVMWFEILTAEWGTFYTNNEKIAADLKRGIPKNHKATFWYQDNRTDLKKLIVRLETVPF